ncbi:hypothetical protein JQ594_15355 [Bradyrhizobium manausense]|uniref:hypothetical protein n=1 Tax=Bradyrhizobium manausense TaxID=989370 RepID=UPI001BA9551F|nr:hypothetical protein [Bradyrhizobium manausense]MBR0687307.1 hypothetical protein [Bradyrhizobium manausense]
MNAPGHLAPIDVANLLAGHAVSCATAYLDGRHTAQQLADNADRLFIDLLAITGAETGAFLVPVQLLTVTMMRTARCARDLSQWPSREDRWQAVMASLVDLVMHESRQIRKAD